MTAGWAGRLCRCFAFLGHRRSSADRGALQFVFPQLAMVGQCVAWRLLRAGARLVLKVVLRNQATACWIGPAAMRTHVSALGSLFRRHVLARLSARGIQEGVQGPSSCLFLNLSDFKYRRRLRLNSLSTSHAK